MPASDAPSRPTHRKDLFYLALSFVLSVVVVGFGVYLAVKQHPDQELTIFTGCDVVGVFLAFLTSLWETIRLIAYRAWLERLNEVKQEALSRIFLCQFVLSLVGLGATFGAAATVDRDDLIPHALAVSVFFLASFCRSAYTWYTSRPFSTASVIVEVSKKETLEFLSATVAYLLVTLVLSWQLHWRSVPARLDVLHGFLAGAIFFHLSLTAWITMLENFGLIPIPRRPDAPPTRRRHRRSRRPAQAAA